MNLTVTKEAFLNDISNKKKFVKLLTEQLQKSGCHDFYDKSDADLLIVKKTFELAESLDTVLDVDDTDLLILLLFHALQTTKAKFFLLQIQRNQKAECGMLSR